ncbi:zinc finger protein 600 [Amyelois transitella]|uniref:zinc finger protein 600 n=1 Tax=Amyelois transitella TaxID=680683 RepID=UPI00298F5A69|nr:zinc finger protein 600 [Amyelois transitella]XP_060809096.1 zinc finger protein 600 [Amyelois transitella]
MKTKSERLEAKLKKKKQVKIKPGAELQKHRVNAREVILYSNATPIRCRGGVGYACCFCKDQFPDPGDLKRHTNESHDDSEKSTFMKGRDMISYVVKLDITALKCKICDENIDTVEAMIEHLNASHNHETFPDVKNHILPFKFEGDTLRCFMCLNVFNKFKVLQEHMNTHYRNFVCDVCDAGFVNRHILYCHTEIHRIGSFKCDHCQLVFETVRKRKFHIRSAHGDMNLHKCGYCNQRFRENWYKNEHLAEVHGVKSPSVKCQACDKAFDTRQGWLLHTKRVHLMQKQHKCSECEMEFFSKRELNDHAVKHTGSREHQCEICMKFYGRLKTLKDHMRRVHADRQFKCMKCELSFMQKSRLRIHLTSKHKEDLKSVSEENQQ